MVSTLVHLLHSALSSNETWSAFSSTSSTTTFPTTTTTQAEITQAYPATSASTSMPNKTSSVDNKRLFRIGVSSDLTPGTHRCVASLTQLKKTDNCTRMGWENELWSRVLAYLDIEYQLYHLPVPTDYGAPINGTNGSYSGAIGMIQNGTLDTVNVATTLRIGGPLAFTYPMKLTTFGLIMRRPAPPFMAVALRMITVFSWEFYATFAASMLVMAMLIAVNDTLFSKRFFARGMKRGLSIRQTLTKSMRVGQLRRVLTRERMRYATETTVPGMKTRNSLILNMSLLVMIIGGVYQGSLLTRLLLPDVAQPISTLTELADEINAKGYRVISTTPTSVIFQDIAKSVTTPYRLLNEALARNPPTIEPAQDKLIEKVRLGSYVYPVLENYGTELSKTNCDLIFLRMLDVEPKLLTYLMPKNHPLLPKIDRALVLFDTFATRQRQSYEDANVVCAVPDRRGLLAVNALSVISLTGLFLILLVGCLLGLVTLLLEMFHYGYVTGKMPANRRY